MGRSRRGVIGVVGVACAGVALTGAVAGTAYADTPVGSAYVWANVPDSPNYVPSTAYQYNSTGATNTVERQGVGQYTVNLPRLGGSAGTVLVTAYRLLQPGRHSGQRPDHRVRQLRHHLLTRRR